MVNEFNKPNVYIQINMYCIILINMCCVILYTLGRFFSSQTRKFTKAKINFQL